MNRFERADTPNPITQLLPGVQLLQGMWHCKRAKLL